MKVKAHVKAGGFWGSAWKDAKQGADDAAQTAKGWVVTLTNPGTWTSMPPPKTPPIAHTCVKIPIHGTVQTFCSSYQTGPQAS